MGARLFALGDDGFDAGGFELFPSSTVVAVPVVRMPALRRRASASALGMPKVKLNTAGRASITAAS